MKVNGYTLAIQRHPSGVGPQLWIGELRDHNDRPVKHHINGRTDTQYAYPVTAAPATPDGLNQVIDALTARAESLPPCVSV